ncbi:MAG: N-acetyl-gamma-glutamyl-phosphate reductase [Methylophilaceae bacterium]|nr:N-acetyl-gamma-glutamyl-phosphate reductase [Methylophilaceae bacterium]
MSCSNLQVGVVGGTGYTGVELLRILSVHPKVDLVCVTSRTDVGSAVDVAFPSLRGRVRLNFVSPNDPSLKKCHVVFFASPNGVAMQYARELLAYGVRVIDLAADFRIRDVGVWERWYAMTHIAPDLIEDAIYGLPERYREEIKTARLIANPGCYPTAIQLGFMPLLEAGVVDISMLIADAKSGISGAGRRTEVGNLFSETSDNFMAYAVSGHRHWPEIHQELSSLSGVTVGLTFVPHLTPMIRGIHATLYAKLNQEVDVQLLFEQRYQGEQFVDILPAGGHPDTRSVRGANICRLAVHRLQNTNTVIVLSVIDNLVKGAAGQAVQNMNIMFDFPESTAINSPPLSP